MQCLFILISIIGACLLFLDLDMTESLNETDHTCLPSSSGSEVSVKGKLLNAMIHVYQGLIDLTGQMNRLVCLLTLCPCIDICI